MLARNDRTAEPDKRLYYELLFSTFLESYEMGIIIEDLMHEVADVLAWEQGLADLDIELFIEEVRNARDLNRSYIRLETDVN
jgi:hypothetical protein